MKILSITLIAVLVLLALNAVAYGAFFVVDPEGGLGEFGYDTSGSIDDGAKVLVGLVGIAFLGAAAFSVLAGWMVFRGNRAGLSVTLVLGGTYLLIGVYAIIQRLWVDAYIYGGFGVATTLLAAILWKPMAPAGTANQSTDQAPDQ